MRGGSAVWRAACGGSRHVSAGDVTTTAPTSVPRARAAGSAVTTVATPETWGPATSSTAVSGRAAILSMSVQSDAAMKAAGNDGPASSILAPLSCVLDGAIVTAQGGYTNGEFAPNDYNRYGDVGELYVFSAATPGHPLGVQVAVAGVGTHRSVPGWLWGIDPKDIVVAGHSSQARPSASRTEVHAPRDRRDARQHPCVTRSCGLSDAVSERRQRSGNADLRPGRPASVIGALRLQHLFERPGSA